MKLISVKTQIDVRFKFIKKTTQTSIFAFVDVFGFRILLELKKTGQQKKSEGWAGTKFQSELNSWRKGRGTFIWNTYLTSEWIFFTHRLIEEEKGLLENELRDYEFKPGGFPLVVFIPGLIFLLIIIQYRSKNIWVIISSSETGLFIVNINAEYRSKDIFPREPGKPANIASPGNGGNNLEEWINFSWYLTLH